jgi:hypothetical protein
LKANSSGIQVGQPRKVRQGGIIDPRGSQRKFFMLKTRGVGHSGRLVDSFGELAMRHARKSRFAPLADQFSNKM